MSENECPHQAFRMVANVQKVGSGGTRFLEVTGCCTQCGRPLKFLGLPVGLDIENPTGSATGFRMWAPCVVDCEPPTVGSLAIPVEPKPKASEETAKKAMDALVELYSWQDRVFDIRQAGVVDGKFSSEVVRTETELHVAERWISTQKVGSYSYSIMPRRPVAQ